MEPFGLLNFLKTALSLTDFSQNDAQKTEENPPAFSTEKTSVSNEEQRKNVLPDENDFPAQNAFTQFLSAHDERVKKTKK